MKSATMRAVNSALAELDQVHLGRAVRVALIDLANQISHDTVATLAAEFVKASIDNWDPPGPEITDRRIRKIAKRHAAEAVEKTVRELLAEMETK